MGFFAFAENPIFLFFAIRPTPFDRGLCFLGAYMRFNAYLPPSFDLFRYVRFPRYGGLPIRGKPTSFAPRILSYAPTGIFSHAKNFRFQKSKTHRHTDAITVFYRLPPIGHLDCMILQLLFDKNKTVSCELCKNCGTIHCGRLENRQPQKSCR